MCDAIWGDDGKPIPGVFDCDSNCNLVQPESDAGGFHACGPGLTCYVSPNGSACTKRTGGGVHGQLCDGGAGCANGYACLRDGTCGKWCIGASDCPAGYTCDTSINRRVASTDFGLCVPDGCDRPTSGACGPNPQCGCGSGMSCDVMVNAQAQAVYACRAVGSTSAWAACDLQTDCPRGTSCVDNQCQPFCTTDASCGEPYTICRQVFPPLSNPPKISGFTSCARPCDPYQPTQMAAGYSPCSEGSACSPSTDGRSYCREIKNAGGSGDACSQQTDCGAGFVCMNSDSGGALCQLLCRVNSSDCSRGRCLGLDPKVYVGNVEWGTCVL